MSSSSRFTGAALVTVAACAFSAKAVIIKLAYRHGVDPVTLLALRMLISAPFFLALGLWSARGEHVMPLTRPDWRAVVLLGMMGYYLASLCDFIGLQYITAALERLVLFLYPTMVLLLAAIFFKRKVTRRDLVALALSYGGIVLVVAHDFSLSAPTSRWVRSGCFSPRFSMPAICWEAAGTSSALEACDSRAMPRWFLAWAWWGTSL